MLANISRVCTFAMSKGKIKAPRLKVEENPNDKV